MPHYYVFFSCKSEKSNTKTKLGYQIINNPRDQFYFKGKLIPTGCFAQLMTELNGDNIQATIYLGRNSYRGCLTANLTDTSNRVNIGYTINQHLANDTYKITLTEKIEGSLITSKDKIIVQFVKKEYILSDGNVKSVLSIDKKGDW